jgi:hypothetical protein
MFLQIMGELFGDHQRTATRLPGNGHRVANTARTDGPDLPPSRSWQLMKDKQCSRPAVSIIIVSKVFKPAARQAHRHRFYFRILPTQPVSMP